MRQHWFRRGCSQCASFVMEVCDSTQLGETPWCAHSCAIDHTRCDTFFSNRVVAIEFPSRRMRHVCAPSTRSPHLQICESGGKSFLAPAIPHAMAGLSTYTMRCSNSSRQFGIECASITRRNTRQSIVRAMPGRALNDTTPTNQSCGRRSPTMRAPPRRSSSSHARTATCSAYFVPATVP